MTPPSTSWREQIEPGEEQRFQELTAKLVEIQKRNTAKLGNGRALHRKQLLALEAQLEILADIPETARNGLFAKPMTYAARIRLSNGTMGRQSDSKPDIRGFALKLLGVEGANALDGGACRSQDFLMINRDGFGFARAENFFGLVLAAAKGPLAIIKYLIGEYGLFGGLKKLKRLDATQRAPFSGFASEKFHTVNPLKCGDYAMRLRLLPAAAPMQARVEADWGADFRAQLERAPLVFELQMQQFVNEKETPIEDATEAWSESAAPFTTVARLTIPQQPFEGAAAELRAKEVEGAAFDPWNALAAHRPLGNIMRARKVAYFASETERGAK